MPGAFDGALVRRGRARAGLVAQLRLGRICRRSSTPRSRPIPDLAIAAERVLQAEAQVRIAGATLFPVLDFRVGTTHLETRPDGGDWRRSDVSSGTLSASYEIDVWGKNSAGVRSAQSSLFASRYDRETVRLTLVAGVANAYFQVLSLRGRLAIARDQSGHRQKRACSGGIARAQRC